MSGTTTQRIWKVPTLTHPSLALAPLALIALMMVLPALPAGFHLAGSMAAPRAAAPSSPLEMLSSPSTVIAVPNLAPHGFPAVGLPASAFKASAWAGALKAAGVPAETPTAASSTIGNFQVPGSDCAGFAPLFGGQVFPIEFAGSSVASPPGHNTTIDIAGATQGPVFGGVGGVNCTTGSLTSAIATAGLTSVWHSTDGGQTFANTSIPINQTHWNGSTSDPSYGGINWGTPAIAAGANNIVMVANTYVNGICYYNYLTSGTGCTNSTGLQSDWGIAISVSNDGGVTFNASAQINAWEGLKWINFGTCTAFSSGFYFLDIAETPSIAINPSTGLAIATWDVFQAQPDPATCTDNGQARAQYTISTNNGQTWSTPGNLSGLVSESAAVSIGPAPTYAINAVFDDFQNSSSGISLEQTDSTNNGATWTAPKDIVTDNYDLSGQAQFPDAFFAPTIAQLAADGSGTSPYKGHVYAVWQDNQTGSSFAGADGIRLIMSANNGTTWGSYVTVAGGTGATSYIEPSVSVAPNGNVWITYYALSTSSGNYNLDGSLSTDGGAIWSTPFLVSDSASSPGSSIYDIGARTGLAATSNGAYPSWTDCRNAVCDSNGDTTYWTANPQAVSLSSNAAGVPATVTTAGVQSVVTLPATLGWDNASTHTISVPQYVPDTLNASDVWGFVSYSGLNTSTSFSTTFTWSGVGSSLTATYTAVPAAVIKGTFSPISGASLKLNNQIVPLTPDNATALQYTISVASGIAYTFTASASKYQTQIVTVFTSGGGVYWQNYTLVKSLGSFKGTLTPFSAHLTINGTVVSNVSQVNGAFNVPEVWGWYWVNASDPGTTSFSEYLEVFPGLITTVGVTLFGGWIAGTVSIGGKTVAGLVLKVDGNPVTVAVPSYTFNQSVLGGFHNITATAPGYNLSKLTDVYVTPGIATSLSINLTNRGWVSGTVGPVAALVHIQLHITTGTGAGTTGNYYPVAGTTGVFNVSLLGDTTYTVNLSAAGYKSFQNTSTYVTPGNATNLAVTLSVQTGGCTSNCGTQNCTVTNNCNNPPPPSTSSGSSFPTTDVIIIVVIVVLAAVVGAVLLMRRGRGGGSQPADYDEGPDTYQDTSTGAIPKLQPDGSMGGPPPPTQ
ncbi:MAG: glycoside hydrolase [Thermoplasmata archaeon]|nr:glycoside hydrolase [Thermoplasmata archaeon]